MNDDILLFERLKASDRGAFEALFRKYYPSFCSVAFRYVEDKDVAKDIAQEVFIKLWNKRNDYTEIPSVRAFLYVLVKNACLNYIRDQKIREKHLTAIERQGELFFQHAVIPEEVYRQLEAVIEKLAPQSANIMRLTLKGFSNTEIAKQLGVSVNTVKTLKYNSLRYIRENLHEISLATVLVMLNA
jgi:RNA polymerase sigma-70 factor (family 1)